MFKFCHLVTSKHGRISKGALETYLCETNPFVSTNNVLNTKRVYNSFQRRNYSRKKWVTNNIVTLDPNKFAKMKQRRVHFYGDQKTFQPRIVLYSQSKPVVALAPVLYYDRINRILNKTVDMPFPRDLKAFLYYFRFPDKPRISGELRLRVTRSDNPKSFESGSDLLAVNGWPWSYTLPALSRYYLPLYEKLREDGFVPDDLHGVLSSLPKPLPVGCLRLRGTRIFTLNDTFKVDFSLNRPFFTVITEKGLESIAITPFRICSDRKTVVPYTGEYTRHHLSNTPRLIIL